MKTVKTPLVWILFSIIISLFVVTSSLLGIFNSQVYIKETINWALQARGQDIGNLIAVPIFLISTYYLARKFLKAFFIWLGSLMYFIYAYLVYSFAAHFNFLFLVYVAILGLSLYTMIGGLIGKDYTGLTKAISLNKKTKTAAILLIIIGVLFGILWLSEVVPSIYNRQTPKSLADTGLWVNPIHVIDLSTVLPGMILIGILNLKRKPLGLTFTAPWLTFSVLMGLSIVATMIMMFLQGDPNYLPPLVMVGTIVLLSLVFLCVYLRQVKE